MLILFSFSRLAEPSVVLSNLPDRKQLYAATAATTNLDIL